MNGSVQNRLSRMVGPPVKLTYDVASGGAIEKVELPFIVGILADLAGDAAPAASTLKDRQWLDLDRLSFDQVMASIRPRLSLDSVPDVLSGDIAQGATLSGALVFACMDDFEPLAIVQQQPQLQALYQARSRLLALQAKADLSAELAALLHRSVSVGQAGVALRDAFRATFAGKPSDAWSDVQTSGSLDAFMALDCLQDDRQAPQLLGQFWTDILAALAANNALDAGTLLTQRVAQIDNLLGAQLNLILHQPALQQLEAAWRGLHHLAFNTRTGDLITLRVVTLSKSELQHDLMRAGGLEQSALFQHLHAAVAGAADAMPYSLLVGDYRFDDGPDDMALLQQLADLASAFHAPFISSVHARSFDRQQLADLAKPQALGDIFDDVELAHWTAFRQRETSRYVSLALPRVLLRLPYGDDSLPVEGLSFDEDITRPDAADLLWGNAAYILAQGIIDAFALHHWPAAFLGHKSGGLVDGLPTLAFKTRAGDAVVLSATQVQIADGPAPALADLGFMAIRHSQDDHANYFATPMADRIAAPVLHPADLPCILTASRFVHYLQVLMRAPLVPMTSPGDVQDYLNTWLAVYVLLDDTASMNVRTSYPLREGQLTVMPLPGNPAAFELKLHIQPCYQLESLSAPVQLVARLPARMT